MKKITNSTGELEIATKEAQFNIESHSLTPLKNNNAYSSLTVIESGFTQKNTIFDAAKKNKKQDYTFSSLTTTSEKNFWEEIAATARHINIYKESDFATTPDTYTVAVFLQRRSNSKFLGLTQPDDHIKTTDYKATISQPTTSLSVYGLEQAVAIEKLEKIYKYSESKSETETLRLMFGITEKSFKNKDIGTVDAILGETDLARLDVKYAVWLLRSTSRAKRKLSNWNTLLLKTKKELIAQNEDADHLLRGMIDKHGTIASTVENSLSTKYPFIGVWYSENQRTPTAYWPNLLHSGLAEYIPFAFDGES